MAAAALLRNPRSRLIIPRCPFSSFFTKARPLPPPTADSGDGCTKDLRTAILAESDPDRLVAAFESIAPSTGFHFHPYLYPLALRKLHCAGRRDLMERLLDHSATHPDSPRRDDFTARIINLYSSFHMLEAAVRTFDAALASSRPIADRSLHALLTAFLKAGRYDRAISTFNHLTQQQAYPTPGLYPHNILLKLMCRKGDVAAARQLLDEMADKNTTNIASYTVLLDEYLRQGDEAAASGILAEIEGKGLVPDVITYNCRVAALCRKKEVAEAEEMLDEMCVKGVAPDSSTFKLIILAYDKVGDLDSAFRVFNKMMYLKREESRRDLAADIKTYNILMEGLVKKGDFDAALEVCKECLRKRKIPRIELVKGLAERLKGKLKLDEARAIVENMGAVLKGNDLDAWKKFESELCLPRSVKDRKLSKLSRRFPYAPPVLKTRNR